MSNKKSDLLLEIIKEEAAAKEALFDAIDAYNELKRHDAIDTYQSFAVALYKEESSPKEEDLLIESLDQAAAKNAIFVAIADHQDVQRKLNFFPSEEEIKEAININRFPFLRSKP